MINVLRIKNTRATRPGRRSRLAAFGVLLSGTFAMGSALAQGAPKPDWSVADMPSQKRRIVLVTGGTSGMGFEAVVGWRWKASTDRSGSRQAPASCCRADDQ